MIDVKGMFNARSVAVVGASAKEGKTGHTILKNIIDGGYTGKIYPINPKADEILGVKCCADLSEIPGTLDLAVMVVPAAAVPGAMRKAGEKGAKGAIIISGGFREIGEVELEAEVMGIAAQYDMCVVGPNCQGVNYTPNKLCASWPLIDRAGSMAVVAQSGTIGAAMAGWAAEEQIGISAAVALGNKSGIGEVELLRYFADDPATSVIALNVEGVKDGRAFMDAARYAVEKKPVVVLKPGRTARGRQAAESHTKSIAGSDAVFDAVCRQVGVIRAEGITEFYDYCKLMALLKRPAGNRALVITSSGGSGILATDTAEGCGVDIHPLGEETKAAVKALIPSHCVVSNPLDLTGDTGADRYETALGVALADPEVDMAILIFGDPIPGAYEAVERLRASTGKPLVVVYLGGGDVEKEESAKMLAAGIPVFPTPERAVRAIGALLRVK